MAIQLKLTQFYKSTILQQKVVLKIRKRIGMQILGRTHLDYICKMPLRCHTKRVVEH